LRPNILDPIAPICSRLPQLLSQGELKCEAARQEGTVEQTGAHTNMHAAVVSIIALNDIVNTGDNTIFATTSGRVSDYV
jgi:hypothetical protein